MMLKLTYEALLLSAAAIIFIQYLDPIPMAFMVGVVMAVLGYELLTTVGIIEHDKMMDILQ